MLNQLPYSSNSPNKLWEEWAISDQSPLSDDRLKLVFFSMFIWPSSSFRRPSSSLSWPSISFGRPPVSVRRVLVSFWRRSMMANLHVYVGSRILFWTFPWKLMIFIIYNICIQEYIVSSRLFCIKFLLGKPWTLSSPDRITRNIISLKTLYHSAWLPGYHLPEIISPLGVIMFQHWG